MRIGDGGRVGQQAVRRVGFGHFLTGLSVASELEESECSDVLHDLDGDE